MDSPEALVEGDRFVQLVTLDLRVSLSLVILVDQSRRLVNDLRQPLLCRRSSLKFILLEFVLGRGYRVMVIGGSVGRRRLGIGLCRYTLGLCLDLRRY